MFLVHTCVDINTWYVVNFIRIRMDLSISEACKRLGKKLLSGGGGGGGALKNTILRNGHVSTAKMFGTVIFLRGSS